MAKRELYDITVKLLHETHPESTDQGAILVTDDDETKVWLPKSQCEFEDHGDGTCTVTAKEWLLKDKGLL